MLPPFVYPLYGLVYLFKRPDMLFQVLGEASHTLQCVLLGWVLASARSDGLFDGHKVWCRFDCDANSCANLLVL